jgi:hypothetical protein
VSIKFDLTDAKLSELVSNAILEQMDGEMRTLVIKQAIEHLTKPEESRGYYGTKESPIQKAFNHAVETYSYQIVNQWVANSPEVRVAIERVMAESAEALIAADNDFRKIITDRLVQAVIELRAKDRD